MQAKSTKMKLRLFYRLLNKRSSNMNSKQSLWVSNSIKVYSLRRWIRLRSLRVWMRQHFWSRLGQNQMTLWLKESSWTILEREDFKIKLARRKFRMLKRICNSHGSHIASRINKLIWRLFSKLLIEFPWALLAPISWSLKFWKTIGWLLTRQFSRIA